MYFNELVSAYDRQRRERNIYHDLMRDRVREVLLVGSLYDSFVVESDGVLTEQIYGEYFKLNLNTIPRVTCAYTEESALDLFREGRFDLVIIMASLDFDMPLRLAALMRSIWPDIPLLLMVTNNSSLAMLDMERPELSAFNRIFVWNGYSKLFVGMIKYIEDWRNVEADTRACEVRVILLIEDSVRYYSRYLPVLYKVVLRQTQALVEEEHITETYKLMSIRARPKILLASTYEEALRIFETYKPYLLTVITDIRFNRNGACDENAGFDFVRFAKQELPDLPVLVQSSEPNVREKAFAIGASFIDKNSESLEMELASFLQTNLGFGNFIFRLPDGKEITRARNMSEFVQKLNEIPIESLLYHAEHNHFSAWLMARGEIHVAKILRPYKITDFSSPVQLRQFIVRMIDQIRSTRSRGMVPYFDPEMVEYQRYLCKIADGSVGGKGRGLIFIHSLLENLDFSQYIQGVRVSMPNTVFVGIDEFERFLELNGLWAWAYYGDSASEVRKVFVEKSLTLQLQDRLRQFLAVSTKPLAVRSSGLFEDMLMVPFSGVYDTYILPNNHPDPEVRLKQLCDAIKLIYASLFSKEARAYFEAANYNLEEERMAVVIQELVGSPHGGYFYPHAAGVAQSYNYYPVSYVKPEDGLCIAALGLGTYVVGGGSAYRFCPKYPKLDVLSPDHALESTQRYFHALSLEDEAPDLLKGEMASLSELPVSAAEKDRYFPMLASTWDSADQRFVPGVQAKGSRVIDFANMLKYDAYPFAKAIEVVLDVASKSMGTPVEIEYAFNFDAGREEPVLYLLQLKPLIHIEDRIEIDPASILPEVCFILSRNCMGNGRDVSIRNIIWVDPRTFDRSETLEIAAEIDELDAIARQESFNYLLIGPGRWGTRDRWLGIPVSFSQISHAKAIVEADLPGFAVESS
ncbi:MAG: PEP/pyruvate-binding domain-containing protein, partial [Spirochaetia bacterium]|nr:PEP/pyruvate-binding domain-containing protein [Spirochaetia bacterium]